MEINTSSTPAAGTGADAVNSLSVSPMVPLCVDLDGTLVATDTLFESLLVLLRREPWRLFQLPFWFLQGRSRFKQELSRRAAVTTSRLPYRGKLLEYLRLEKAGGRTLILATAANEQLAKAVADHLGIFDGVIASTRIHNLKGSNKAASLVSEFGERGFDYVGDTEADMVVWSVSRRALVVGPASLADRVAHVVQVEEVFDEPTPGLREWVKALRLSQWVKNILVFTPLLAAHKLGDIGLVLQALVAFLAFSLCASAVYIINDLLDLEADRAHPRKSMRPFASGRLSIASGLIVAPILLVVAFLLSARLPPAFAATLALYFAITLAYSLRLKRTTVLDVLLLAGLYTLRLIAGGAAVSVRLSFWLLAFSMFLFLSLALVKRVAELQSLAPDAGDSPVGRSYRRDDIPVLLALGTASGYTAVLVFALYINSSASELLYRRTEALWLLCPLFLFWITRVWLVTHRGTMHDDPIVFAFRDSISRWLAVAAAAMLWLAI